MGRMLTQEGQGGKDAKVCEFFVWHSWILVKYFGGETKICGGF
jgi:hypothetical protein